MHQKLSLIIPSVCKLQEGHWPELPSRRNAEAALNFRAQKENASTIGFPFELLMFSPSSRWPVELCADGCADSCDWVARAQNEELFPVEIFKMRCFGVIQIESPIFGSAYLVIRILYPRESFLPHIKTWLLLRNTKDDDSPKNARRQWKKLFCTSHPKSAATFLGQTALSWAF